MAGVKHLAQAIDSEIMRVQVSSASDPGSFLDPGPAWYTLSPDNGGGSGTPCHGQSTLSSGGSGEKVLKGF